VSSAAETERLFKATVDSFGRIDVVVNSAGKPSSPARAAAVTAG
jgi:NAD(P)-dependent dehydrogenase (short-subunit alcohol dehydrogenase family)